MWDAGRTRHVHLLWLSNSHVSSNDMCCRWTSAPAPTSHIDLVEINLLIIYLSNIWYLNPINIFFLDIIKYHFKKIQKSLFYMNLERKYASLYNKHLNFIQSKSAYPLFHVCATLFNLFSDIFMTWVSEDPWKTL